ncbi:hypothetical protein BDN71DRAFT_1511843 [Pleurotus eryngii]|uniref:Uncharacterized protein n=1 Tax=Pleurotus eryngii TaxID=5323 RepID=A0A9P6D3J9_PLEER|nr:hypothetical protein BDN71DRAFT_1511843 [Pleurotus eryngii]
MVSSFLSPAKAGKDSPMSLATLAKANRSLTSLVTSLTNQVSSLTLMASRAPQSQSLTSTLVTPAVPPTEYDSDDKDRLSYITDPGEGVTMPPPVTEAEPAAIAPAAAPVAAPATVPAPTRGPPARGSPVPAAGQYHPLDIDLSLHWYLMTVGRAVGIFQGWENVAPLVLRAQEAIFNRQPSWEVSLSHFDEVHIAGLVRIV